MAGKAGRNVLCLAIDSLRPDVLGAYGNSDFETSAFDRLAAQSLVFDFAFCESPNIDDFCLSAWYAVHPAGLIQLVQLPPSIVGAVREAGYHTALITDEPYVTTLLTSEGFEETIVVPASPTEAAGTSPTTPDPVQLATTVVQWLQQEGRVSTADESKQPWLLWVHIGALTHLWPIDREPDGMQYAFDVEDLDRALSTLLDCLADDAVWDDTLILLVGCRGLSLGEHMRSVDPGTANETGRPSGAQCSADKGPTLGLRGCVSNSTSTSDCLFEERIHIPLIVCSSSVRAAPARSGRLVSVRDLGATIADWCGVFPADPSRASGKSLLPVLRNGETVWRDALLLANRHGETGVRTTDWYLRSPVAGLDGRSPPSDMPLAELYSKPDDRWDANEISSRCGDIVEELLTVRDQLMAEFVTENPKNPENDTL